MCHLQRCTMRSWTSDKIDLWIGMIGLAFLGWARCRKQVWTRARRASIVKTIWRLPPRRPVEHVKHPQAWTVWEACCASCCFCWRSLKNESRWKEPFANHWPLARRLYGHASCFSAIQELHHQGRGGVQFPLFSSAELAFLSRLFWFLLAFFVALSIQFYLFKSFDDLKFSYSWMPELVPLVSHVAAVHLTLVAK